MNQMEIHIVNSYNGFNGPKSYSNGISVGELFDLEMRGQSWSNFTVRVNRQETRDRNTGLRHGDRVSITPSKVDAGC